VFSLVQAYSRKWGSPSFRKATLIRYKILWLEVEKHHFIFIIGPHVN
jgi:hypothetical protein